MVYNYASQFFSLPQPHHVQIADAETWVAHRALDIEPPLPFSIFDTKREELIKKMKEFALTEKESKRRDAERYNVIVHDVFTGGALPEGMFTSEFWDSLRILIRDEGVVAVVSETFRNASFRF